MRKALRSLSIVFSAGALGGFANCITVWLFGALKITGMFGVSIAPPLTPQMIYHRVTWGGIWGILFLIPLMQKRNLLRGILWSIGPTLIQLFVIFPVKAKKGIMGLGLGTFTPLFVILFNTVWGIVAAYWLKLIEE
jgi:hypothetical protein